MTSTVKHLDRIESVDYQRNGIAGKPFDTAIIRDPELGRILVIRPEQSPGEDVECYVTVLDKAAAGDLSNGVRGDVIAAQYDAAIQAALTAQRDADDLRLCGTLLRTLNTRPVQDRAADTSGYTKVRSTEGALEKLNGFVAPGDKPGEATGFRFALDNPTSGRTLLGEVFTDEASERAVLDQFRRDGFALDGRGTPHALTFDA